MKQNVAMKAFVIYNGKVLLLRESLKYESPNTGKWDVPGGRVKPGERFDQGLIREIKEETGLEIKLDKPFSVREWRPAIREVEHQIIGTFIECFADSDEVILSRDHDRYEWINPEDHKNYDLVGELPQVFGDYLNR